jgi:hypothetical protein
MRHLLLAGLLAPALLCAQQNTKTAKIEELFKITKVDQMQKQMMAQMGAMMKQQEPAAANVDSQKIMDFVARKMSWESMKPDFVKLYDQTYTEDEISGILMFYESAPGQALLAKSPLLMSNTMAMIQKRVEDMKPELDKMIKDMAAAK